MGGSRLNILRTLSFWISLVFLLACLVVIGYAWAWVWFIDLDETTDGYGFMERLNVSFVSLIAWFFIHSMLVSLWDAYRLFFSRLLLSARRLMNGLPTSVGM